MVRGSTKKKVSSGEMDPESTERKRLKNLAFANNVLSETQAKLRSTLSPSNAVVKHHGKDIVKKSHRKNRFLFSFPGLLAPISGGKIGELKDLGTKNPTLYLDFPQGRMKLFGTIVYPKNRYLTLQFPRGGKNVLCEDSFDNMIVFADAWWIGRKDDNPEEARLNFPKELSEGQHAEYDFSGGAGSTPLTVQRNGRKDVDEKPSLKDEPLGDDTSQSEDDLDDLIKSTPVQHPENTTTVRHSERTAGKKFKFVEASSGDHSDESGEDISEGEEKKVVELSPATATNEEKKNLSVDFDIDDTDVVEVTPVPEKNKVSALSASKSKKSSSMKNARSTQSSLVQPTISTLFKKVEEKKAARKPKKASSLKVSDQKLPVTDSKQKIHQGEGTRKRRKVNEGKDDGKSPVGKSIRKKKEYEVEEDDIEQFSSTSEPEGTDDEDWAA